MRRHAYNSSRQHAYEMLDKGGTSWCRSAKCHLPRYASADETRRRCLKLLGEGVSARDLTASWLG